MKIYFKDEEKTSSLAIRIIIYSIIALLLSLVHIAFLGFLSVEGITPDFLLILCVWISLAEGQMIGSLSGFSIGLLLDIISLDVIGTNALAKTFAGFISGWFYKKGSEQLILGSLQFLGILF
ncbi:MAG: rod shape-determining protein MreD, partial [Bacteroidota bacterium]|nr:rod shape-determining protein MreD [Bacteroidota bacterium]